METEWNKDPVLFLPDSTFDRIRQLFSFKHLSFFWPVFHRIFSSFRNSTTGNRIPPKMESVIGPWWSDDRWTRTRILRHSFCMIPHLSHRNHWNIVPCWHYVANSVDRSRTEDQLHCHSLCIWSVDWLNRAEDEIERRERRVDRIYWPLSLQRTKRSLAASVFNSELGLVIIRVNLQDRQRYRALSTSLAYLFLNFCPSVGKWMMSSPSGGKMNCRENFLIVRFDWHIRMRSWRTGRSVSLALLVP